jgi:hypothetical protein
MGGAVRAVESRGGVERIGAPRRVDTLRLREPLHQSGPSNIKQACGHCSVHQIWVQMRLMRILCVTCWRSCLLRVSTLTILVPRKRRRSLRGLQKLYADGKLSDSLNGSVRDENVEKG